MVLRYAPRARAQGSQGKQRFFFLRCAPVPAPKVHRESKELFFAPRASCPRLKFTGEARKQNILRYARFFFSLLGPVPTPKVRRESKEKFSFRFALESRKLCVSLGVNKVKNVPSLCATECNN